jgi:methionine aminopeptidase
MKLQDHPTSFGVFKPVGHIVISFPSKAQADDARQALTAQGITGDAVRPYTAGEMLAQINVDLAHASPLANLGQEINLIKAHRALAERGYHWLVVRVKNDEMGRRVADTADFYGAERAQLYGRFIIEELISHAGDTSQVAESPDRGLDPQTPSGLEAERAVLRPPRAG